MRRLMLLVAAGSLWLFLAAVPAFADGGPHVASVNSGTSSLTADSCAGCHRAHTAQGEYLLAASSEEALCLSCHGALGTGATTDVEDGVQYVPNVNGTRSTNLLGALRDGGFINARIGASTPSRMSYLRSATDLSTRPKVPVGASEAVTSAHLKLAGANGVTSQGRVWGSGTTGLGASPVDLTCVECHNPHGDNQYRILKPVPGTDATAYGAQTALDVVGTFDLQNVVKTDTQHGFVVNDQVKFSASMGGLTAGTTYYVRSVPNGFTFTVATSPSAAIVDLTNSAVTGTVTRVAGGVADSPVDPDGNGSNPTKNYTVLETKGSQGMNGSFLLYARDVTATGGTAFPTIASTITSTDASNWITTSAAHGLTVGDLVALVGVPGIVDSTYTVSSVQSNGTLFNQFKVFGQTATASQTYSGTATRQAISGNFTATGGDYFRRTVPWNPALVNSGCDNTVYAASGTLSASACGTMNDAPNGRPNAVAATATGSTTGVPSALIGQQAFVDQMSTWCAACHTRYYQASNENIGNLDVISTLSDITFTGTAATDQIQPKDVNGSQQGIPAFGDQVTFAGTGTSLDGNTYYVVQTGSTGSGASARNWFKVAATLNAASAFDIAADFSTGTFTKVYQSSNSGWGYPRYDNGTVDPTYKFQHSTASNRACTVCHVGHGSNAAMTGAGGTTFSANYPYPSGVTNASSRLLKVDNRGTCQMCHDPTGTVPAGTLLPTVGGNTQIP